ncbi:unnamed protein product [Moneuplotes crassus]|uniref:Uncharacterized protein n=1 Tax=Euplotes crassus TaxID=5936 RepID=A0AAD1U918_EUPCR|nr:unnamed protein product [Moneuplotes crassus]
MSWQNKSFKSCEVNSCGGQECGLEHNRKKLYFNIFHKMSHLRNPTNATEKEKWDSNMEFI